MALVSLHQHLNTALSLFLPANMPASTIMEGDTQHIFNQPTQPSLPSSPSSTRANENAQPNEAARELLVAPRKIRLTLRPPPPTISDVTSNNALDGNDHAPPHRQIATQNNKGGPAQYPLALATVQRMAREILRESPCRWRSPTPCSAHLASHNLLVRHVHMHIEKSATFKAQGTAPDSSSFTCAWARCQIGGFTTTAELEQHVATTHLEPRADLSCPFIDCKDRNIRSFLHISDHYDSHNHLQPWTEEQLIPRPLKAYRNAAPKPLPIPIPEDVPPYLLSCNAVLPHRPIIKPPPLQYFGYSLPSVQPLATLKYPILPERSDDIPFAPTFGEPVVGYLLGASSSVFPANKTYDDERPIALSRDAGGNVVVPSSADGPGSGARPLSVRKRPHPLGRPRLVVPPDVQAQWQQRLQEAERRKKRKGKDKMIEDTDEDRPIDAVKVRRTAQRLAAKRVGRSIGVEFWKEVLAFEAEGWALGEVIKRRKT